MPDSNKFKDPKEILLSIFSERDFNLYFGARNNVELCQIADTVSKMAALELQAFKIALASMQAERILEQNHGSRTH